MSVPALTCPLQFEVSGIGIMTRHQHDPGVRHVECANRLGNGGETGPAQARSFINDQIVTIAMSSDVLRKRRTDSHLSIEGVAARPHCKTADWDLTLRQSAFDNGGKGSSNASNAHNRAGGR